MDELIIATHDKDSDVRLLRLHACGTTDLGIADLIGAKFTPDS